MARVRLRVILDEPDRAYRPGEVIRGRVESEADEACTVRELAVSAGWATTGEASAVEGNRAPLVLGHGEWKAGDRRSTRFAVAVPEGPPTYFGHHFSVVWTVSAVASLAFAFDAQAEAVVTVLGAPAGDGTLLSKEDAGCVELGCALAALALFLGAGAAILLARGNPGIGFLVAAALGAILALVMAPFALAYRAAGKVTVEIGPAPVARGDELACRVVLAPRKHLRHRGVRAVLTAVETSSRGSGKSKTNYSEEVATVAVDLEGPSSVGAGEEGVYAGMVAVPTGEPPSLAAGSHRVTWKIKVSVVFDVLPNPNWDFEVAVA